jgi:hypothetical protein
MFSDYPLNANLVVDLALDKYIHELWAVGWEAVQDELEKNIAPTPAERAALCKRLEKHLEEALGNGIAFNKSTELTLAMVGPRDMECLDYSKYPLGKTASFTLDGKDVLYGSFFRSTNYHGTPEDNTERAKLVKELITALKALAE